MYHDMGMFDECLDAVDPIRDKDLIGSFQGKYCTVFFNQRQKSGPSDSYQAQEINSNNQEPLFHNFVPNFIKPSVAFCIPSTCSGDELRSAVTHHVRHLLLVAVTNEDFCHTHTKIKAERTFGTGSILTRYIFLMHIDKSLEIVSAPKRAPLHNSRGVFMMMDHRTVAFNCELITRIKLKANVRRFAGGDVDFQRFILQ